MAYEFITVKDQIANYKKRIAELEGSLFLTKLEIAETEALKLVAVSNPLDYTQLESSLRDMYTNVKYTQVRIDTNRDALAKLEDEPND